MLEHGATSAMDLSDGLMGDLPKILSASSVSARLDEREIPVAAAVNALFPNEWIELAMRGGEDYELLFTAAPGDWHGNRTRNSVEAGGNSDLHRRDWMPNFGRAAASKSWDSTVGQGGVTRSIRPLRFGPETDWPIIFQDPAESRRADQRDPWPCHGVK